MCILSSTYTANLEVRSCNPLLNMIIFLCKGVGKKKIQKLHFLKLRKTLLQETPACLCMMISICSVSSFLSDSNCDIYIFCISVLNAFDPYNARKCLGFYDFILSYFLIFFSFWFGFKLWIDSGSQYA